MEVDAEVILTLQGQIQELRGQVEALEYFRDLHMGTDIGQSGFNYPHPNQKVNVAEYGGGLMRMDKTGIQILAIDESVGITWLRDNLASLSQLSGKSYAQIKATTHLTSSILTLINGTPTGGQHVEFTMTASGYPNAVLYLGGNTIMTAIYESGAGYFAVLTVPFWLPVFTADKASPEDGQEWYRSDLDRFRVRANGITRNLTMDGTNTTLTIATGTVTITTSFHAIDTEAAGATDDLDTISGGQTGQVLYLHAANGARDVVAKDGTGNLKLAGDFTMNNTEDMLTLIYNGTNWLELARSDNGA